MNIQIELDVSVILIQWKTTTKFFYIWLENSNPEFVCFFHLEP